MKRAKKPRPEFVPETEVVPGLVCWTRTIGGGKVKVTILSTFARESGSYAVVEDHLRGGRHQVPFGQLER